MQKPINHTKEIYKIKRTIYKYLYSDITGFWEQIGKINSFLFLDFYKQWASGLDVYWCAVDVVLVFPEKVW